jgi:4a-hydroxytetrahydrobiopterin dehydratase
MDRVKLTCDAIAERLKELNGWRAEDDALKRRFEFGNFTESLAFVNKIGAVAEAADHHPDIAFGWGYAEIAFTTHDRGGITDVDFAMAEKVSAL